MGKEDVQPKIRDTLFDILLIVELQEEQGGKTAPFISYRFPQFERFESDPFCSSVTQFCFPDINQFPTENMQKECFSFVLTEGDGERRFGYCLRKLPPGSGPRFPVAFSIMAFFPCFTLYTKILEEVAYHYENTSLKMLSDFLQTILSHPFPLPGKSFNVKIGNDKDKNKNVVDLQFTRPDDSDSQIDHVDLDSLLLVMDEKNIVSIFASMLIERRIIFCSSKLSTLSSCVQTAVALLYPFTWQHIYIPVLPKSLLSFCCAPMPFVVGILASELNEVLMLPMDEVLIIDLDEDSFIRTPDAYKNDIDFLPPNSCTLLTKSIRNTRKMIQKYHKKKNKQDRAKTDQEIMNDKLLEYELKKQKRELKDAFLEFFVSVLGSYRGFIQNSKFDREKLIESQPPELKMFMELLVGSQMFERFIEERVNTQINNGGFERAVSRMEKEAELAFHYFGDDLKKQKKSVLGSLRSFIVAKSDEGMSVNSFTLSQPTLVQSTSDRAGSLAQAIVEKDKQSQTVTESQLSRSSSPIRRLPQKHFPIPNKPLPPIPIKNRNEIRESSVAITHSLSDSDNIIITEIKKNRSDGDGVDNIIDIHIDKNNKNGKDSKLIENKENKNIQEESKEKEKKHKANKKESKEKEGKKKEDHTSNEKKKEKKLDEEKEKNDKKKDETQEVKQEKKEKKSEKKLKKGDENEDNKSHKKSKNNKATKLDENEQEIPEKENKEENINMENLKINEIHELQIEKREESNADKEEEKKKDKTIQKIDENIVKTSKGEDSDTTTSTNENKKEKKEENDVIKPENKEKEYEEIVDRNIVERDGNEVTTSNKDDNGDIKIEKKEKKQKKEEIEEVTSHKKHKKKDETKEHTKEKKKEGKNGEENDVDINSKLEKKEEIHVIKEKKKKEHNESEKGESKSDEEQENHQEKIRAKKKSSKKYRTMTNSNEREITETRKKQHKNNENDINISEQKNESDLSNVFKKSKRRKNEFRKSRSHENTTFLNNMNNPKEKTASDPVNNSITRTSSHDPTPSPNGTPRLVKMGTFSTIGKGESFFTQFDGFQQVKESPSPRPVLEKSGSYRGHPSNLTKDKILPVLPP